MSDEQTEILRQILETQKEQLAFAKQHREEFAALQRIALARQSKALRLSAVAVAVLVVALGLLFLSVLARSDKEPKNPSVQQQAERIPGN
jgi:hypothetical protein